MFSRWKEKRKKERERKGFGYALTALLYDETETIETLRQKIQEAKDFGEYNDFDRGIEMALGRVTVMKKV